MIWLKYSDYPPKYKKTGSYTIGRYSLYFECIIRSPRCFKFEDMLADSNWIYIKYNIESHGKGIIYWSILDDLDKL